LFKYGNSFFNAEDFIQLIPTDFQEVIKYALLLNAAKYLRCLNQQNAIYHKIRVTKVIVHRSGHPQLCLERLPITAKQVQDGSLMTKSICGAQKNEK
jgi:hypothetical protein